ncbi:hypothetical protein [Haladaptatus sp.]|uniref:hypothetical protein n=1 Tax=Haladaptatus sp. TaxID=1973141 RepID=UPI003C6A6C49
MVSPAGKTALISGAIGFIAVFLVALFALGYNPQQSVVASISPAIGAAIGIYIANRFIIRRN